MGMIRSAPPFWFRSTPFWLTPPFWSGFPKILCPSVPTTLKGLGITFNGAVSIGVLFGLILLVVLICCNLAAIELVFKFCGSGANIWSGVAGLTCVSGFALDAIDVGLLLFKKL